MRYSSLHVPCCHFWTQIGHMEKLLGHLSLNYFNVGDEFNREVPVIEVEIFHAHKTFQFETAAAAKA